MIIQSITDNKGFIELEVLDNTNYTYEKLLILINVLVFEIHIVMCAD